MNQTRRVPSVLNSYEQLILLKQPNSKAPTGLRNLCLLSMMLKLGLRVSEVINIQNENIDWEKGKIFIKASGAARERILWIEQAELDLLEKWHGVKPEEGKYFFSTLDGSKLKDRYVREMVKRLARKAGINKDVYPHLLRYTFAADLIRETNDIKLLQEALGHRDISTTQSYTSILFEKEKEPCFSDRPIRRSGIPVSESEQRRFSVIDKSREDQQVTAANISEPSETSIKSNQKVDPDISENDLNISVVAEKDERDNIAIPAIKCSQCSYILHYQGNCPKCGTSFTAILRHWGKDI